MSAIAVVGMACRYPDANSPAELWENVLAQRRAFRRLPTERLPLNEYYSTDPAAPDRTCAMHAAVITGYEFDRDRFRVSVDTFRSTDLAHWLALDVAAAALLDAGLGEGEGAPRDTTGVIIGNTLTGEFSRANALRVRWPFVRRIVDDTLIAEGWADADRGPLLHALEHRFKAPFPAVSEATLAGGLSNTIAGRITNHFNFRGGGYTVDGACASSLLAVITGCRALVAGDLDVALVGGVDLSLDPFELIGFAKVGALAIREMRVYDRRAEGFWPGEGCGMVVLMRQADAIAHGHRVIASISGWGVSSDGRGGITRPEVIGQLLALRRAYARAGVGADTVAYFEGHGTGTPVGDAVELEAIARARRSAGLETAPAVIGSVKANIGHTKAAAGVAGLIKAVSAVNAGIIPPTTGCVDPCPELLAADRALEAIADPRPWPQEWAVRAGVSAMGFGGINTHVVVDGSHEPARRPRRSVLATVARSARDLEVIILGAEDSRGLARDARTLAARVERLSWAEMGDLATHLARAPTLAPWRGAVVGGCPTDLAERLRALAARSEAGGPQYIDPQAGVFLGGARTAPRIGLLFPGQGAIAARGRVLRRLLPEVEAWYQAADMPSDVNHRDTAAAQPATVAASIAGLIALEALAVPAQVAIGYSLGEVSALCWAGALTRSQALALARSRGQAMSDASHGEGAMATFAASAEELARVIGNEPSVVVAGINGPRSTTIAGPALGVERVVSRAAEQHIPATRLDVTLGFHSPHVAPSLPVLRTVLANVSFTPLSRQVVSTVTGALLAGDTDLRDLLERQVCSPVRFAEAIRAAGPVDLWVDLGAGNTLTRFATASSLAPVVALNPATESVGGVLRVWAAAFALGVPVQPLAIDRGRFTRPISIEYTPHCFASPCETQAVESPRADATVVANHAANSTPCPLQVVKGIVAAKAELVAERIGDDDELLADLHLHSIAVTDLVAAAARALGRKVPVVPSGFTRATIAEVARFISALPADDGSSTPDPIAGVGPWVRAFVTDLIPEEAPAQVRTRPGPPLIVTLPKERDAGYIGRLLAAAKSVHAMPRGSSTPVLVLQHDGGAAAFARSLFLESGVGALTVIDIAPEHPAIDEIVAEEAARAEGFREVHYGGDGVRRCPVLRHLPLDSVGETLPIGREDVILVSGGGKGIGAECALALARASGARLALLGRSPHEDPDVQATLARMRRQGATAVYARADLADARTVAAQVASLRRALGPITAVVHAAGVNVPRALAELTVADVEATLAPKVTGALNLLAALEQPRLRLFLAFGSIIARIGMEGEAHYALANDWLTDIVRSLHAVAPGCLGCVIDWSLWAGTGMGERLGRVDEIARRGVEPISIDAGTDTLLRLLRMPDLPARVVVAGRLGPLRTVRRSTPEIGALRFVERPVVFYPGIELVADSEISAGADPYLEDHELGGERLLPATVGLEALAQAARGVGADGMLEVLQLELAQPVIVPRDGVLPLRLAALAHDDGTIEAVLRSGATSFQVDHFRARFISKRSDCAAPPGQDARLEVQATPVGVDPGADLYGPLLFHGPRFQRVQEYAVLAANHCTAHLDAAPAPVFGEYVPPDLVLGDPLLRDAAMHAIQACLPHARVLPVRIERMVFAPGGFRERAIVRAVERQRRTDGFTFDVDLFTAAGELRERWIGLELRVIERLHPRSLSSALAAVYIERRVEELLPGECGLSVTIGESAPHGHRFDGRPESGDDGSLSISHAGALTLVARAARPIGCDIEPVAAKEGGVWRDLLGRDGMALVHALRRLTGRDAQDCCTQVWSAREAAWKTGLSGRGALHILRTTPDGWVLFGFGSLRVVAGVVHSRDAAMPLAIAVAVELGVASAQPTPRASVVVGGDR